MAADQKRKMFSLNKNGFPASKFFIVSQWIPHFHHALVHPSIPPPNKKEKIETSTNQTTLDKNGLKCSRNDPHIIQSCFCFLSAVSLLFSNSFTKSPWKQQESIQINQYINIILCKTPVDSTSLARVCNPSTFHYRSLIETRKCWNASYKTKQNHWPGFICP